MNTTAATTAKPAKTTLSLHGEPADDHFWFVWVITRRSPRRRYSKLSMALRERDRLRALGLDARCYEARTVEAQP
jgi:hypothetical protein